MGDKDISLEVPELPLSRRQEWARDIEKKRRHVDTYTTQDLTRDELGY